MGWNRREWLISLASTAVLGGCKKARQVPSEPESLAEHVWTGIGFGIDMAIHFYGLAPTKAEALASTIEMTIAEIERAFSHYSDSSELSRLNHDRKLLAPSQHFRSVVELSRVLEKRTLGYFQPAVHGVVEAISRASSLSDELKLSASLRHLHESAGGYRLLHPATRLSFNAIAQGYLTDQLGGLLRAAGVRYGLLQTGETLAIGRHPEGRPWKLAVMGTPVLGESDLVGEVAFENAGLAVSTVDASREMLDPVSWQPILGNRVVAVLSDEGAAVADAFATAFAVAPSSRWEALGASLIATQPGAVKIWLENNLEFER